MDKLKSQLESLLFISAKPMSIKQLAELIESKAEKIKQACNELENEYKKAGRGLQIIRNGTKYQMVSSPDNAKVIQSFVQDETKGELSRPSLETLTIIAYRGPVNKIDLDRIRGINCSLILRNLLLRGLIESNFDQQKKDTYYTVSFEFIRFLGISDVKDLPDYSKLNQDDTIDKMLNNDNQK